MIINSGKGRLLWILQQNSRTIYDILRTQLQFGVYRYMDSPPTIEEASVRFSVSVDTVRLAYLKLKKDGYISLTKNIGAKALIQYGEEEIAQHIQGFFAPCKDALIDLGKSMLPLFGNIQ